MSQTQLSEPADLQPSPVPPVVDGGRTLGDVVASIARLGTYDDIPDQDGLHHAVSLTHQLIPAIVRLQNEGVHREEIVSMLEPARRIHGESPFIRRLQEWPRGYPGDFETVEYLVQQQNRATPGRFSYWLEQYALDSSIAQQHRNKVDLQARALLASACGTGAGEDIPRILVLAAGGSPDLRQVEAILADHPFEVTLLDQDADALAFSASRLPLIRNRLTLVNRNIVRGLQDVARQGPFDLVLAGGLFDYLPDNIAVMALRTARRHLLRSGGQLMFTNIAAGNPYRAWIEHLAEWQLLHRTAGDVRALCSAAGFADDDIEVGVERTGLTLIVTCHRPES